MEHAQNFWKFGFAVSLVKMHVDWSATTIPTPKHCVTPVAFFPDNFDQAKRISSGRYRVTLHVRTPTAH
jgi:hypothetical protein